LYNKLLATFQVVTGQIAAAVRDRLECDADDAREMTPTRTGEAVRPIRGSGRRERLTLCAVQPGPERNISRRSTWFILMVGSLIRRRRLRAGSGIPSHSVRSG